MAWFFALPYVFSTFAIQLRQTNYRNIVKKFIIRAISGILYGVLIIASLVIDNELLFDILFGLIAVLGIHEFNHLMSAEGRNIEKSLDAVGGLLLFLVPVIWVIGGSTLGIGLYLAYLVARLVVQLYIKQGNPLTYKEAFENADGKDQAGIDGERDETVATMADFLSKLSMEIYLVNADGTKQSIFSASPDKSAQLTDSVLLGTFAKGETAKLQAVLHVPAELGSEYANRVGEVDWLFTVEGFNNEKPLIPTGQLNWPVAVFGALGVLLIAGGIIVLTKKKKNEKA